MRRTKAYIINMGLVVLTDLCWELSVEGQYKNMTDNARTQTGSVTCRYVKCDQKKRENMRKIRSHDGLVTHPCRFL